MNATSMQLRYDQTWYCILLQSPPTEMKAEQRMEYEMQMAVTGY